MNASKILHLNVTEHIKYTDNLKSDVTLITDDIETLNGYILFSNGCYFINSRLTLQELLSADNNQVELTAVEDEEPFNVESTVKKQFNAKMGQFEVLVKWRGYSTKHNTWELISNIPEANIDKFELDSHAQKVLQPPAR